MTDSTLAGGGQGVQRVLRAVAVQATLLSAAAHLIWAWPRLGSNDPRPYVFLAAAILLALIGTAVLRANDAYRRLYALGAGTLAALIVGYVGWFGASTFDVLVSDPLALVAKVAEVAGLIAFVVLYRLAPPTSVVVARRTATTTSGTDPGGASGEAPDDASGEAPDDVSGEGEVNDDRPRG